MAKLKETKLSVEDKELLLDVLVGQSYALEVISCEIADIESGIKLVDENRIRLLNDLYDRLSKAGL